MATITSAQSGDFSDTATWVGGVVPGAGDDAVAATGHTVVIDVDTTVDNVSQAGTGKFTLGNGRTLTANVQAVAGTNTSGGTVDVVATTTAVINGNVTGSTTNTSVAILISGGGTLTINGDISGGNTNNRNGIQISSGSLTIVGNIAAIQGNGVGISGSSTTVTMTGNVLAGNAQGTGGRSLGIFSTGVSTTVLITGNVTGGVNNAGGDSSATAIDLSGVTSICTIVGNVTGGSGPNLSSGIRTTGTTSTVTVTGDVTGGGGTNIAGILTTGASSTVNVIGSVTAVGTLSHGINSTATANGVIMEGNMTDSLNGAVAIYARIFRMSATNSGVTTYTNTIGYPTGTPVSRVSPDNVTGMASQTDVRLNTVYGFNSELTGSLAVPPANAVGAGVPVDNTTGTAALSPGDIAGLVGAQIAAAVTSP